MDSYNIQKSRFSVYVEYNLGRFTIEETEDVLIQIKPQVMYQETSKDSEI